MTVRDAATMTDVARAAGVSRAAVSKVVRNAYGVSPEMRSRVEAAIDRLAYRPNVAARAIRGKSFTLGFELHQFENPALARILRGAARGIDGSGYRLVVAPAASSEERAGYDAIEALVDLGVDGIVVVAPTVSPDWLERLSHTMPLVMLSRHDRSVGYDTMTGDDITGTGLAMEHLFFLGHDNIAYLTRGEAETAGGLGTPPSVRLDAYREVMASSGRGDLTAVVKTSIGVSDGYQAAIDLLGRPDRPTAILAANDELALDALRAINDLGLTPSQVSVVGYDDIPLASHPRISLTTVDQSGGDLGQRAVAMLIERINEHADGRLVSRHESTTPRLVVRNSSAPPA